MDEHADYQKCSFCGWYAAREGWLHWGGRKIKVRHCFFCNQIEPMSGFTELGDDGQQGQKGKKDASKASDYAV